jgi:hypothetical protein
LTDLDKSFVSLGNDVAMDVIGLGEESSNDCVSLYSSLVRTGSPKPFVYVNNQPVPAAGNEKGELGLSRRCRTLGYKPCRWLMPILCSVCSISLFRLVMEIYSIVSKSGGGTFAPSKCYWGIMVANFARSFRSNYFLRRWGAV